MLEVRYLLRSSKTTSVLQQLPLCVNASLLPQLFAEREGRLHLSPFYHREIENEEVQESE